MIPESSREAYRRVSEILYHDLQLALANRMIRGQPLRVGNSPDICRRHYAALIPEEMHDTVEFAKPAVRGDVTRNATQELIEEILRRVNRKTSRRNRCPNRGAGDRPKLRGHPTGRGAS
jgi:hypothetical protein